MIFRFWTTRLIIPRVQIFAGKGGSPRTEIFPEHGTPSIDVASNYAPGATLVAGSILLGWYKVLRLLGGLRRHREFLLPHEEQSIGCLSDVKKRKSSRSVGLLR